MDYKIFASKRSDVSRTSRDMEHFIVEQDDDGTLAEEAKQQLQKQGYRVHGVIPQSTEETAPRKRNGR